MNKLEQILAINERIRIMNKSFSDFRILIHFDDEGKNGIPKMMCIQLQHNDWRQSDLYYEVYIDFQSFTQETFEGEDLDVTIDIDDVRAFDDTCRLWIGKAIVELEEQTV